MNIERTVHICGKDVKMRYCTATETGYEEASGKSSAIFIPKIIEGKDGNPTKVIPQSTTADCILLATAGIVAAYTRINEEAPITADNILYEAEPEEVTALIKAILEMRNEWYKVPSVVNKQDKGVTEDDGKESEKN